MKIDDRISKFLNLRFRIFKVGYTKIWHDVGLLTGIIHLPDRFVIDKFIILSKLLRQRNAYLDCVFSKYAKIRLEVRSYFSGIIHLPYRFVVDKKSECTGKIKE